MNCICLYPYMSLIILTSSRWRRNCSVAVLLSAFRLNLDQITFAELLPLEQSSALTVALENAKPFDSSMRSRKVLRKFHGSKPKSNSRKLGQIAVREQHKQPHVCPEHRNTTLILTSYDPWPPSSLGRMLQTRKHVACSVLHPENIVSEIWNSNSWSRFKRLESKEAC